MSIAAARADPPPEMSTEKNVLDFKPKPGSVLFAAVRLTC
jgi:hypothetical protein